MQPIYYGDDAGAPGTILAFFPWKGTQRAVAGADETHSTAFSAPSVEESARELERMGADVELLRHPGRPHTILQEELAAARKMLHAAPTHSTRIAG